MTDREILKEILRMLQERFPKDVPEQKMGLNRRGSSHYIRIGVDGKLAKKLTRMAQLRFTRKPILARRLVCEGLQLNAGKPVKLSLDRLLQTTSERRGAKYENFVVIVPTSTYNEITKLAQDCGGTRSAVCEYLIALTFNNQPKEKHE